MKMEVPLFIKQEETFFLSSIVSQPVTVYFICCFMSCPLGTGMLVGLVQTLTGTWGPKPPCTCAQAPSG